MRTKAYSTDLTFFLEQFLHACAHDQAEGGEALRLARDECEEAGLGHHRNVGELRLQVVQIEPQLCESPGRSHQVQFGMGELQQAVGKTKLIHHLQNGGVKRVATKVAVEVQVRFKQHHVDALACQHEGEGSPRWSGPHDDAPRLLHIPYLMGLDGRLSVLQRAVFLTHTSVSPSMSVYPIFVPMPIGPSAPL